MQSIPTIFLRDKDSKALINKPLRMVDWVFQGRGTPTRKYNGIAIKVENGKVFRRYEWRQGEKVPSGFEKLADFDPRRPNASIPGWVPINPDFYEKPNGVDERALREAWKDKIVQLTQAELLKQDTLRKQREGDPNYRPPVESPYAPDGKTLVLVTLPDGTYELCGPKIRGNPEKLSSHVLYRHGEDTLKNVPRSFEGLKNFLETFPGEGIVWHYKLHPDRVLMAKIKRRDFGF